MEGPGPLGQIARRVENLGGTRLMLRGTGTRDEADILCFRVPDMDAAVAVSSDRGADFSAGPRLVRGHPDGTEEWMAFFKDDEGRDLALHMQRAP